MKQKHFQKRLQTSCCHPGGRIPPPHMISCPINDIVNFLAELFQKGYQYGSLNSYRSAISSVHEKVDGMEIGHLTLAPPLPH